MTLPAIGTLWVGPALSWLEQLCLQSFVDHGHEMVLFSYDPVENVPPGVRMAPASDLLPGDRIMRHARTGSPAYHADVFRLNMMRDTDLIWADTDAYCVRPWEVSPDRPFYGWISDDVRQVNNGVLRLPGDSETLARMIAFAADPTPIPPWAPPAEQERLRDLRDRGEGVHVTELPWGVLGPDLLTHMLLETGEIAHAQPGHVLYPVPFRTAGMTLNPNRVDRTTALIRNDTLSIHFWGRRFRNTAAKAGGRPEPGCYVEGLLARHGIDPAPTAHLMKYRPPSKSRRRADLPDPVDFSMFSDHDVANLVLQRSEVVASGPAIRALARGDSAPLHQLARDNRDRILTGALNRLRDQCELFLDRTDAAPPRRVADVGCGYAFSSLILWHRYDCDLVLIDIEENGRMHFGFEVEGAAYADLNTARRFLEANGVPGDRITTLNPRFQPLDEAGTVDLMISQISCGFHYPVDSYLDFMRDRVGRDGAILLDIRKGSNGVKPLRALGRIDVLDRQPKYATVFVRKDAGVAA
ncbi:class I SAM-dependent methyltransferase [Palleronia sediminis]|uniref:Class I SAM-dependent methyltransferase n=1 Tax=Palleronia sediminis TaxID=2547833 RepID=A0A4R6A999_9RHOB|nr:class I SAM-dependent methyltransferase [Palleronia sediminis]TDL79455.1 class I SAM-dependent methyltransferase [Palleronia sediminis]